MKSFKRKITAFHRREWNYLRFGFFSESLDVKYRDLRATLPLRTWHEAGYKSISGAGEQTSQGASPVSPTTTLYLKSQELRNTFWLSSLNKITNLGFCTGTADHTQNQSNTARSKHRTLAAQTQHLRALSNTQGDPERMGLINMLVWRCQYTSGVKAAQGPKSELTAQELKGATARQLLSTIPEHLHPSCPSHPTKFSQPSITLQLSDHTPLGKHQQASYPFPSFLSQTMRINISILIYQEESKARETHSITDGLQGNTGGTSPN